MNDQTQEYRLESVRKIREKYRDDAAIVVKKCRGEVEYSKLLIAHTSGELESKQAELEKEREKLDCSAQTGARTVSQIARDKSVIDSIRKQRDSLAELLQQQRLGLLEREQRLESAQEVLLERVKELKVIEKHRENWKNEREKTQKRAEQRQDDELSQGYSKRKT